VPDTPPNALPAAASLFEIVAGRERRIILERPSRITAARPRPPPALRQPLSTLSREIKRLGQYSEEAAISGFRI
jgi:hypothetical protein